MAAEALHSRAEAAAEAHRARVRAATERWRAQAEAEEGRIREEALRNDDAAEHRAAEAQLKAEAADRLFMRQMRNRSGFLDKKIEAEAAIREGRPYEEEPSSSFSLFSDSEQGSSPAPAASVERAGSAGAAATVIVLSDDE